MHERVGNYWYLLPEYSQARKSMWDAVNPHTGKRRIDEAFPREIRKRYSEQEMMIASHNGSTFQLLGADNFHSLVGSPPVGLIFSEYARTNPSAWAYLMPILEENGGWVGFNSTPLGNNHFKSLCRVAERTKGWFYEALTAEETGVFTAEQLQSILEQLQATHGEDYGKSLWLQEYFVSFDAAIPGAIWGDCIHRAEMTGRIGDVPHDPDFPVFTAWDLGRTDDTAIWFFQVIAGEIRLIDYHASSLKEIEFYAELLRDRVKNRGYTYDTHFIPHDARPRRLGMGGKSILQQLQEHNVGRFVIAPRLDVQEGIQAARATFPKCHFDASRCEQGLECLRHYHREWDDETKRFKDTPEHDWSSHGADAFRYLSLVWRIPKPSALAVPLHKRLMNGSVRNQTFGQLKKAHFAKRRVARDYQIH
jgi:phage terminase large subunit